MKKLTLKGIRLTEEQLLTAHEKKTLTGGAGGWICYCDRTISSRDAHAYCFDITYDHLAPDC
ncbi:MAG: hypothetical protein LBG19_13435 [Prevotellaceae bacterium]|jgi:hypothetical protein|nr:hypothetical protein [Prevotellaceae bacterium]